MSRFRPSGLLASAALAFAAASALDGGQASAALSCTFGNPTNCLSTETNLTFSNFSYTGDGIDTSDNIQIQALSPTFYSITFTPGGTGGNFDGTANIPFTISTANGYTFKNAAAASTMAPGTPFVFNYNSASLAAPLTTSGSQSPYQNITTPSTANIVLSWSAGSNFAQGTAFYINLNPPVPGPLPLAGASAAFFASRRLRSRINSSQA